METKKPKALLGEHLEYLDILRESGQTNMFAARSFLINEFPELEEHEAKEILIYWMRTFSERHKREDQK